MKTRSFTIITLLLAALSLSPALLAGNARGPGRGQGICGGPEKCPNHQAGLCPAPGAGNGQCLRGSPENCPNFQAGNCPAPQQNGQGRAYRGANNPNRSPKQDGTGAPGKSATSSDSENVTRPNPRR